MKWQFSGNLPVYQQIIAQVEAAALSGVYPPGGRVPSVRELAAQAQVNPNTMQRALSELERRSLLVNCGAAGRFVTSDRAVLEQLRKDALQRLARECADKFAAYGLSPAQAAAWIADLDETEEEQTE